MRREIVDLKCEGAVVIGTVVGRQVQQCSNELTSCMDRGN